MTATQQVTGSVVAVVAALAAGLLAGCAAPPPAPEAGSLARLHVLRLRPGDDLRQGLLSFAKARDLRAASVVTAVGSVTRAVLRYADRPDGTTLEGKREIVSLVGTLTRDGCHLHASLADGMGVTLGGHLLDGAKVYTTAEITLVEAEDLVFAREPCPLSGYDELAPRPREER